MIYPSVHRYNAPYRGPRDRKDISDVMTSIWYDTVVAEDTYSSQRESSDSNVIYAMSGKETPTLNMDTSNELNGEVIAYMDINNMVHALDSMSTLLENAIKNL